MTSLLSNVRFFCAGLMNQPQMGAIVPSQRFLIARMLEPIPLDFRGRILEVGAGTGALTLKLAARCPSAEIVACEINPVLARDAERHLARAGLAGNARVVTAPAEEVLPKASQPDGLDFVISGIPLGTLGREKTRHLVDSIYHALKPGGMYIQFQHSLLDRKNISQRFSAFRISPVLLNFPPAVVYYACR